MRKGKERKAKKEIKEQKQFVEEGKWKKEKTCAGEKWEMQWLTFCDFSFREIVPSL